MKFYKVYFNKLRILFRFLESVFFETNNIVWQNYFETFRVTVIVIVIILFLSIFLWFFDLLFVKLLSWLIF